MAGALSECHHADGRAEGKEITQNQPTPFAAPDKSNAGHVEFLPLGLMIRIRLDQGRQPSA